MNDPLLPPPTPSIDRRQMLEDLKARKASQNSMREVAPTSRTTKKKGPRPARAAKILVFGLSTTAMFGAVTGYALADMQKNQQPTPAAPVAGQMPSTSVATSAGTPVPDASTPAETLPSATQDASPPALQKKKTQLIDTTVPAPPAVDQQALAPADSGTTNVVDVPVPSAAQAGQGQISGGSQQSSGSH